MSNKAAIALAVVALMTIAYVPCCSTGEGAAGITGTFDDPKMLSSDYTNCRILCEGEEMTAYFGINWGSFFNPVLTVRSWTCDDENAFKGADPADYITLDGTATQYPDDGWVSASVSKIAGTDDGIYALKLTASESSDSPPDTPRFYKFKVILTESISFQSYSQEYYYGIYLKIVDDGLSVSVKGTTGPLGTDSENPLQLKQDTIYQTAVFNGEDSNSDDYYYYAKGLPDGFNMRLNGIIAGKASGEIFKSSTEGMATLYAISKLDSTEVYSGPLYYTLALNGFEYSIDVNGNQRAPCFEDGYVAIKNTDEIIITLYDLGSTGTYEASIIHGDTPITITIPNDLSFTIKTMELGLSNDTGIVQLKITKTIGEEEFTTTIHMMLVGPVVHSGLSPTVTSARRPWTLKAKPTTRYKRGRE